MLRFSRPPDAVPETSEEASALSVLCDGPADRVRPLPRVPALDVSSTSVMALLRV